MLHAHSFFGNATTVKLCVLKYHKLPPYRLAIMFIHSLGSRCVMVEWVTHMQMNAVG